MNDIPLTNAKWLVLQPSTRNNDGRFEPMLKAVEMYGDLDLLHFALGKNSTKDIFHAIVHHPYRTEDLPHFIELRDQCNLAIADQVAAKLKT